MLSTKEKLSQLRPAILLAQEGFNCKLMECYLPELGAGQVSVVVRQQPHVLVVDLGRGEQ